MRARISALFAHRYQVLAAIFVGLALRIFLVLHYPAFTDDSALYEELARNWISAHIYGLSQGRTVAPSDVRVPGYPAFLALIYLAIRRGNRAIALVQVAVDVGTCFLTAWLATLLVPERNRARVSLAALWLAATCPFIANYAAVPLAEVLATFLTAGALVLVTAIFSLMEDSVQTPSSVERRCFLGGLLTGLGTLVRPETPLLLAAFGTVLAIRWRKPADWGKLVRAGAFAGLGLILPLIPWTIRNAVRLHEFQPISPRYAATPDEYVPRGLYEWTATWLVRFRDVYLVPWNVGSVPVHLSDVSPSAFDSPGEKARVGALLDQYNAKGEMTPAIDAGFAELARERTMRHPFRTYFEVPFGRALTMWFTPRVDLLPFSGHIWPLSVEWRRDRADVVVTLFLGALNFFYAGLAVWGMFRFARSDEGRSAQAWWPITFVVVFAILRTAFLTHVETPEPRYVLECYPDVLALCALAWLPRGERDQPSSRASGGSG